ncbi:MAG: undecaprenyldiphospho-muramoylpentapeptide beta-N-acetylglucosaminyltransferase [Acetobacteraceae bacterium]
MGPIVIAAGGTAGHVFPAQALATVLCSRGVRTMVLTDTRAAAQDFAGAAVHVIPGAGVAGRGPLGAVGGLGAIARGTLAARLRLGGVAPAAVVGFGGYPSIAPVLAARLLFRRPAILLHEQNAVLGRANRLLVAIADGVAVSFARTRRAPPDAILTGNPVRAAVVQCAAQRYALPRAEEPARLLVLGGSLGARVFADLVPAALVGLPIQISVSVVQQCRPEDLARVEAAYGAAGVGAELARFFTDMPARIARANLVIARAGASTVAELAAIGRPSILLPLPGAIDGHQRANAEALAAAGAAVVLDEHGLTAERLGCEIAALLGDHQRLAAMADAASHLGRANAADALADLVLALSRRRSRA